MKTRNGFRPSNPRTARTVSSAGKIAGTSAPVTGLSSAALMLLMLDLGPGNDAHRAGRRFLVGLVLALHAGRLLARDDESARAALPGVARPSVSRFGVDAVDGSHVQFSIFDASRCLNISTIPRSFERRSQSTIT